MISFVQCQFSHRYVSFVVVFEVQGHGRLEYYYVFTFQTLICVVNSSLDFGEVNRHYLRVQKVFEVFCDLKRDLTAICVSLV